MVPVVPGVAPGVSAVRPGGRAGQVGERLQPAAGQLGLLQVLRQEAAREGEERPVRQAGLQVGAQDGEPGAVQPQRVVQLCLGEVHGLVPLQLVQLRLLLRHGDPVITARAGTGAALQVSAQPQPFWHRALPALGPVLLQGAEAGGALAGAGAGLHGLEVLAQHHLVHYQGLRGAGQAVRGLRGGQTWAGIKLKSLFKLK